MRRPRSISLSIVYYSPLAREKYGLARHINTVSSCIMLLAYSLNYEDEVHIVDFTCGKRIPTEIRNFINSPFVEKHAFDVEYVRLGIAKLLNLSSGNGSVGWRDTGWFVKQYGLPDNEKALCKAFQLEEPACGYIESCLKLFCQPEELGDYERKVHPKEFPVLWENVKKYCEWRVRTEKQIRKCLQGYPVNEFWMLQERLNQKFTAGKINILRHSYEINCCCEKKYDPLKIYRAVWYALKYHTKFDVGNLTFRYEHDCLWVLNQNGSFLVYVNPRLCTVEKHALQYREFSVEEMKWKNVKCSIEKIVGDIIKLKEHDFRVLLAWQCMNKGISARVDSERLTVVLGRDEGVVVREIIERTRMDD